MRILHFNGHNYRLKISPLNGLIDPAESKLKVKSNSISVELKKAKPKYWDDIKEKKASFSAAKKEADKDDSEKDPGASIMSMMKELYDQGDE